MHKEMTSMSQGISNFDHPFVDSSMSVLPISCEESPQSFSSKFMIPLTPLITIDQPPTSTLSPPYTPSSSHSSPSSPQPHLILSPKDFAPFRAFRRRENVNYSEVKRRPRKPSDDVKRVVVHHKRKNHKVKVKEGEWKEIGKPVRKRVYMHNNKGGQFRACFDSVQRTKDSLILREGDDVTAVTVDAGKENGEIVGVARITRIYVAPKSRELQAAVIWYYLPEQVEDKSMDALPREIFPSKHLDYITLNAIENKVEVLKPTQFTHFISSLVRSRTFPFCLEEKVQKDENKVFFARFQYDCIRKKIMAREKKRM